MAETKEEKKMGPMVLGATKENLNADESAKVAPETVDVFFPHPVRLQEDLEDGLGPRVIEFKTGMNTVNAKLAHWKNAGHGKPGLHWWLAAHKAVLHRAAKAAPEKKNKPEPVDEAELQTMKKSQLVEFAQENYNLDLDESSTKDELIGAILDADAKKQDS